ncbi:GNAT family N-acetyltransferase [Sphingomonas radiodurans]|uniref:GNAT family N-acetyltransferase n=1 Tax=Sphingomonas radiodurans TaxID=2890321 RepID=UPI001E3B88CC|nr:GNAT family N-acetyltransferase [Sphingomonas radiodurans]WBH17584.1 GNAT family N-acetyltransferase [Sphingomonas radiodurans]
MRRWRDADVAPFHAMGQDAEVMRYLGPPMDIAACAAIAERMNAMADATGDCFWAIERRADGAFLGFCGIKPGPSDTPIAGLPEIGWRFSRPSWGQGLAREAAAACLERAWRRGTDRVHAITVPANERSWGLMIRLGMTRVDGGDFDHPALDPADPLRRHVHYLIERPQND